MATRLHLSLGSTAWNVTVARHDVRVDDAPPERVTADQGRLRVGEGEGATWGNAVTSGDDAWVTIDGEVFVFKFAAGGRGARAATSGDEAFTPPMAATVVRIAVQPGDRHRSHAGEGFGRLTPEVGAAPPSAIGNVTARVGCVHLQCDVHFCVWCWRCGLRQSWLPSRSR